MKRNEVITLISRRLDKEIDGSTLQPEDIDLIAQQILCDLEEIGIKLEPENKEQQRYVDSLKGD